MIPAWMLLVVVIGWNGGAAVHEVRFVDKDQCEAARSAVHLRYHSRDDGLAGYLGSSFGVCIEVTR